MPARTHKPRNPERGWQPNNAAKQARADLGLAVSSLTLRPGQTRTQTELAAYCGCSKQRIHQLETSALSKIRIALRQRHGVISTDR